MLFAGMTWRGKKLDFQLVNVSQSRIWSSRSQSNNPVIWGKTTDEGLLSAAQFHIFNQNENS